jgi:hypothetical protein
MFKDKYTLDKNKEGEDKKIQLSPDFFALGEMLQDILKHMRSNK